ncbi:hypothetical protein [Ralstonia phage RP13]|nr:hypothetical protein [Ralstonia phage RP13]
MLINKSDPLIKALPNIVEEESVFNTLLSWKFHLMRLRNTIVFAKIPDSKYILAIDVLDSATQIYGIWDSTEDIGGVFKNVASSNLKSQILVIIPPVQLNPFNTNVFDKVETPAQRIDTKGFEILCRLVNSPQHSHKSHKELAIKAIQLAMEFETNMQDVNALFSQLESGQR